MRRVLALLPAVVAACSLSLDGFTGGATSGDAGGVEAGDAGSDVAQVDAGGDDASVDGGSGFVPCSMRPPSRSLLFCDDFDDTGEQVGSKWSQMQGTLTFVKNGRSSPFALQAAVPIVTSGYGISILGVSPAVASGGTAIGFRFAMNVESLGAMASGYLSAARFRFTDSSCHTQASTTSRRVEIITAPDGTLSLFVVGLGAECNAEAMDDAVGAASMIRIEGAPRWRSMALEASHAPCPGTTAGSSVTLFVDGAVATCAPTVVDPMSKTAGLTVEIGISDGAPWGDASIDYDDVELVVE